MHINPDYDCYSHQRKKKFATEKATFDTQSVSLVIVAAVVCVVTLLPKIVMIFATTFHNKFVENIRPFME